MSNATRVVDELLGLGTAGSHPASAAVGVCGPNGKDVSVSGWAVLPDESGSGGEAISAGMMVDLASVTKVASTTTLAMLLCAAGQLDPSAPVKRYLPRFTAAGKADITVEQLLAHAGGLQPWWPLYCVTEERDRALDLAQDLPLAAAPGTERRYSDLGMILAGQVIERIAGDELPKAFTDMVGRPLGLDARFGPVPARDAATSADSDAYEYAMVARGVPYPVPFSTANFSGWRDHAVRGEANDGNAAHALRGAAGHAGLFASIDDLLRLGAALIGGEFVPTAVLERFATSSATEQDQALGFGRTTLEVQGQPNTLLWHGGFTGTFFGVVPNAGLVVAGAAMRLHGTLGHLAAARTAPAGPHLVTSDSIHNVMFAGTRRAFEQASNLPTAG